MKPSIHPNKRPLRYLHGFCEPKRSYPQTYFQGKIHIFLTKQARVLHNSDNRHQIRDEDYICTYWGIFLTCIDHKLAFVDPHGKKTQQILNRTKTNKLISNIYKEVLLNFATVWPHYIPITINTHSAAFYSCTAYNFQFLTIKNSQNWQGTSIHIFLTKQALNLRISNKRPETNALVNIFIYSLQHFIDHVQCPPS